MRNAFLSAFVLAAAAVAAAPAMAQDALRDAYVGGLIGEQADGYVGIVPGAQVSADVRARVDQVNMGRRAEYTRRATAQGESVANMAAAATCQLFANIPMNARYRDQSGVWRQRTSSTPVVMPSFCGN
jgi:uncharacterized protein